MGAAMKPVWLMCQLACVLALAAGGASAAIDPTAPPKFNVGAGAARESGLTWVRVNGKRSLAWYGGVLVKLGDRVEGGRVSAIREDRMLISDSKGKSRSVYLLDRTVRSHRVR